MQAAPRQIAGEPVVSDTGAASELEPGGRTIVTRKPVDTSDFECNHEPYKSAGNSFCYRCNQKI